MPCGDEKGKSPRRSSPAKEARVRDYYSYAKNGARDFQVEGGSVGSSRKLPKSFAVSISSTATCPVRSERISRSS